ncbi:MULTISPECIES: hypothetical protein [unclassified Luteococcus]|uniref:hypothetical protein n=1 Tax=unclassified Luteococcus TaxID=2639923 RepID=UPI00313EF0F6
MSRSLALRTSIAALAILPAFTACSMLPGGEKTEATPNQASVAPQESSNNSNDNESNNQGSDNESSDSNDSNSNDSNDNSDNESNDNSGNDDDSNNNSDNAPSDDSNNGSGNNDDSNSNDDSNNSSGDDSNDSNSNSGSSDDDSSSNSGSNSGSSNSGGSGSGQQISVPSGSGISNLELVKLQGATAPGGQHGKIVGVFKATTDRPMMLNLRVKLYDASGKMIASKTGLNSVYTTGDHDLVTSNLVTLPAGAKPKSFKVSLEGKTDMKNGFEITEMGKPKVGDYKQNRGVQSLTGHAVSTTPVKGSVTIKAACIKDGKVYQGTDSLSNNTRQGNQIAYDIPMYDAKGDDLSNAKCYVSA